MIKDGRYLTDCENCAPRENMLMNQHVKMADYCEIIEEAVRFSGYRYGSSDNDSYNIVA